MTTHFDMYDEEFFDDFYRTVEDILKTIPDHELVSEFDNISGTLDRERILKIVYDRLPDKIKQAIGSYPQINHYVLNSLLAEVHDNLYDRFKMTSAISSWRHNAENYFNFIDGSSFFGELVKTNAFERLFGVHQLGLNRWFPIENPHSRSEHSIEVTFTMLYRIKTLFNNSPELLIRKLKEDFLKTKIITDKDALDDSYILNVGIKLAIAVGVLHDIYTPAGGDTIKFISRIDEEQMVRDNFEYIKYAIQNGTFDEIPDSLREIAEILVDTGIDLRLALDFISDAINGDSPTLIGELIKSQEDTFDADRDAYTRHDATSCKILRERVPDFLYNPSEELMNYELLKILGTLEKDFSNPNIVANLGYVFDTPSNILSLQDKWVLNDDLELVCTDPSALLRAALFRAFSLVKHYLGPKMFGVESVFLNHLSECSYITKDNLLCSDYLCFTDDLTFIDDLKALGLLNNDEKLVHILSICLSFGVTTKFSGKLSEEKPVNDFFHFFIKVKYGKDTKVLYEGKTITFEEWIEINKYHPLVVRLNQIIEQYHNKWLSVEVIEE